MNKKILILVPCFALLASCNFNNQTTTYDPFMIGDNLEVVNSTEAKLIANEAYNNLSYTTSLRKTSTNVSNDTQFYTGAFSSYSTNDKTSTDSEVIYYNNKIESSRNVRKTTYIGNDSTVEETKTSVEEWFGFKVEDEEEIDEETNYSLLRKTVDKYNGVSSTRFSSSDNFSNQENVDVIWNRHLIKSIDQNYLTDVNISYSSDFIYVRDSQHIVGYYLKSNVTTEKSKIAPEKDDVSYVKKTDDLSVIDFYKDELLGIGWTVKSVSKKQVIAYLTTIDGKETNPIEVSRQESVTSLYYDMNRQTSSELPKFVQDTSLPFFISQFKYNEDKSDIVFDTSYRLENNDGYYRRIEDSFKGHAYYLEQKLGVGYYSFFDNEEDEDYEKWGYDDIIANKCVNYIIDPNPTKITELPEIEEEYDENGDLIEVELPIDPAILNHPKVFCVTEEATFSFRIVFNEDMEAVEFTVAIVAK